jgi:hypothetical protein
MSSAYTCKPEFIAPGLCYYSDHNPQEIQEEIRCWAAKWPLSAQGTSVIPMVPSYWHEITGCSFLKIGYQLTTGHMNAMKVGGSTQAVGSAQAVGSTHEAGVDPEFLRGIRPHLANDTISQYVYHHS